MSIAALIRPLMAIDADDHDEAVWLHTADTLACLRTLERRVLWLSTWTIHHANHLRPSRDGLKVGGHQASSASMTSIMAAVT